MAGLGTLHIDLKLTGDLQAVTRAFGIMSAALAAYGHEFSETDKAALAEAAEALTESVQNASLTVE